MSSLKVLFGEI